jgi:hypothetical protein
VRALVCALALALGEPPPARATYSLPEVDETAVRGEESPALRVLEPTALVALERRGLSLMHVLGAAGPAAGATAYDLTARSSRWRSLVAVLDADLDELSARPGVGRGVEAPNHPFDADWLRSPRAHFELVAVVNRLDRMLAEPAPGCGEVRLVYRLALTPKARATTRLPMTVSLVLHQPADADTSCRGVAQRWLQLPRGGAPRVAAVAALVDAAALARIEIDLQNMHGPSLRRDEDDHAEYVLRSFDVVGDALVPRRLLDTPRADLAIEDRDALRNWIVASFDAIDAGTAVVPNRFLALRAVSVTPRGLARAANRPYKSLFATDADARAAFARLPYERASLVKSPAALLRRLDSLTCAGCHQSRSIAGFHVLGEERDPDARFNALAVGRSSHFDEELPWRQAVLEHVASGRSIQSFGAARPFAEHASAVAYGAHCAVRAAERLDPGFAGWECASDLRCRNAHDDEIGFCVPDDRNHPGDACQDVTLAVRDSPQPDGDRVLAHAPEVCSPSEGADPALTTCSPNAFGFPGGECSDACDTLGETRGTTICADLPLSGFESDCFVTARPIEECLREHVVRRRVRACDAGHPCRDDHACARVAGAAPDRGACVPPYFVLQARVDGPLLDR